MKTYLLASKSRLVALLGFEFVDVLVEGDLSVGDRLDGFDAHVTGCDAIGVLPAPSGAHSGVLKGFLKDSNGILL